MSTIIASENLTIHELLNLQQFPCEISLFKRNMTVSYPCNPLHPIKIEEKPEAGKPQIFASDLPIVN